MSVFHQLAPTRDQTARIVAGFTTELQSAVTLLNFNLTSRKTHHVIPQSCSHASVSLFTEVETVHREERSVRSAVLEK